MSHIFTYHCNVVSSLDLFNHTKYNAYMATYKKHHVYDVSDVGKFWKNFRGP